MFSWILIAFVLKLWLFVLTTMDNSLAPISPVVFGCHSVIFQLDRVLARKYITKDACSDHGLTDSTGQKHFLIIKMVFLHALR